MGLAGDPQKFIHTFDAMLRTLCAGAISPNQSRIDTKAKHRYNDLYDADATCFRLLRQPAFIREARSGEFDFSPSNHIIPVEYPTLEFQKAEKPNDVLRSVWKYIPRLWVLVSNLGEGMHQVTAIYRGDAKWKIRDIEGNDVAKFKSHFDLTQALEMIQQCEGMDKAAWTRFVQKYWDACVLDAAKIAPTSGGVN